MGDKHILIRNKRRVYLNKVTAVRMDKKLDDTAVSVNQETKYKVLNNPEGGISISVNTKTFVEPGVLFSIETEHIIEFMVGDEITVEEINSNIREIIAPLGAEVSYIVASITKEMIGSRMILPPILNLNTADKQ
ncbi:MAG: hypothetical protein ACOX0L_00635 [Natronincolaceae bacterium]|jgi:hypothetical protein|nr:hypothetical protein [Bacillota bacterium]